MTLNSRIVSEPLGVPSVPEPATPPPPPPLISGKLSSNRDVASVQADYAALANDLEQAQAIASTLELQLSGKVNELAQFRHIWERTQADMQKFAHDLEVLRRERHALANQVQRAYAVEHEFERLKRAHEQLKTRTESLEAELGGERILHAQARRDVADLKEALEETRCRPASNPGPNGAAAGSPHDPELRAALQVLKKQLDRVLDAPAPRKPHVPTEPEHIEISFSR